MSKVVITKGAFAGKTGTAVPSRAIGPVDARTFLVIVTLDDGSGFLELPLDAITTTEEPTAMTTPLFKKTIQYDRVTKDFALFLDGKPCGFATTYSAGEAILDALVYDILAREAATVPAPGPVKLVQFDPQFEDWCLYIDRELIGFAASKEAGHATLDEIIAARQAAEAATTADAQAETLKEVA